MKDYEEKYEEFLNDIKYSDNAKELWEKYDMTCKTFNSRIYEILESFGKSNYRSAKKFLQNKNIDEILKVLHNNKDYEEEISKDVIK